MQPQLLGDDQKKQNLKLVILVSGYGSNLQAIIDAILQQKLTATIQAVISDNPNAYGLTRAKSASIPTKVLSPGTYTCRETYDHTLADIIADYNPDLIVLSGFMRILSDQFVQRFIGKLINIHPSLLPQYPGLNTYKRAIADGAKRHGCSVHFVIPELDAGPIIAQSALAIDVDDTIESLKQRTQKLERILYPKVIRWFAEGKVIYSERGTPILIHPVTK